MNRYLALISILCCMNLAAQSVYPSGRDIDMTLPELPSMKVTDIVIVHSGYVSCYDAASLCPLWSAYELTASEVENTAVDRQTTITKDEAYPFGQASAADYTNSGYERGHLAPAADMRWAKDAQKESCVFTNVAPQAPELNRGAWVMTENLARRVAKKYGKVWIVSGTITGAGCRTIGNNRVCVPDWFYKVLMTKDAGGEYIAVAFVYRNDSVSQSPEASAVTVDALESLTGIDFFPAVNASKAERNFDLTEWK